MTGYTIYTDGACTNNGRANPQAGWGAVISNPQGDTLEMAYPIPDDEPQTNIRAELSAALYAIKRCKQGAAITLYSDSELVTKGIAEWLPSWKARGWKTAGKKTPEHLDLWLQIDEQLQTKTVTTRWVKGHSNNAGNVRADALAKRGAAGNTINKVTPKEAG